MLSTQTPGLFLPERLQGGAAVKFEEWPHCTPLSDKTTQTPSAIPFNASQQGPQTTNKGFHPEDELPGEMKGQG